uniref:Methanethiol oxidase n=1 Tax=Acrobeloides nanus TaxID=290746 RepID=A0A914ELW1_9BILA
MFGIMAATKKECCHTGTGPGYASPKEAMQGPREKYMFVNCAGVNTEDTPDMIVTVDVDPDSTNYCKIVSRLDFPFFGDEVHHSGWNACPSCFGNPNAVRSHLVLPCLHSGRIYIVDTKDPLELKLHKVVDPTELLKHDATFPHTTHCLPDGTIMINTWGDARGNGKSNFILLDGKTFDVIGTWPADDSPVPRFNYAFWYQPRHNVMVSTEFGHPKFLRKGFRLIDVGEGNYGKHINIYNWKERRLVQTLKIDEPEGLIPMEVRFLHDPDSPHGFLHTCLGSAIYHLYKDQETGFYKHRLATLIPPKKVTDWAMSIMPALISDILISIDDRWIYIANYIHGDIRQYDISDPFNIKQVAQVFVAGSCTKEDTKVVEDHELTDQPEAIYIKDKKIEGGPHMLQLSLDGKRLYVTTSLYSPWDRQFYPGLIKNGASMIQLDVDTEVGGLKVNKDFLVDFGAIEGGPFLAHEMRYPGGDCTSDIWL